MLRHSAIVNNARLWVDRVGIPDGAGWLLADPLFHTAGCVMGVLGALDRRARLVLMPLFDPGGFLELIEQERPWFRGRRSDDAYRGDGAPRRVAARFVVVEGDDVGRRPGARSAWCAGSRSTRIRLHDHLRPDRMLPVLTNTFPSDNTQDKGLPSGNLFHTPRYASSTQCRSRPSPSGHPGSSGRAAISPCSATSTCPSDGRDAARWRVGAHRRHRRPWTSAATAASSGG